ncbi:conserved hypothetical protein [Leishmania mexicana MHOM/GT/2001/U1103]|uniref:Uncharacterized protein n=1 Tax=Leishmania mexicana (strain MHOM/GT/2001/U1103) TaxID=929439 RepID=E9AUN6_LEIMU|nr:conserved hypothetical protein [Leishmania mexicana MHOM/GT/2001/U1103]CBZ26665.1 conserved hypothetical protein [Leishmania mexicana MHOM/GT/2001/U1103]
MISWVPVFCCRRSLALRLSGTVATAGTSTLSNKVRRASPTSSPETQTFPCAASGAAAEWSATLPDIPYGFPERDSSVFAAERSGGLQKQWLQDLPRQVGSSTNSASPNADSVLVERYLPNKEDFWRSPPYEALREVVLHSPYHDALKIIMEHDYRFLFADVMCNAEAPMPHIIYEDFMKCLTFSSRQQPPEEQFALPEPVLRDLLCWAAYYCTLDHFYFTSASMLFRKVEQEQHMSAAVHSAWVYICTAAGKLEEALAYAAYMDAHSIPFDADVFARLMHPSLTPVQQHLQHAPQTSKGIVLQRRLCQDMSQHHGTMSVAVHAMFVYHILTLRHTRKWEVLRGAAELFNRRQRRARSRSGLVAPAFFTPAAVSAAESPQEVICSRTMQLAMSFFCREKGVRWGPRTTKEMVAFMLENEEAGCTMADVLFVLMRIRRNERTGILAALPRTAFSAEEQEALLRVTYRRARCDLSYAVAGPLLREVLAADGVSGAAAGDGGSGSDEAVDRAMRHLQKLASSVADYDAYAATSNASLSPAAAAGTLYRGRGERCAPAAGDGAAVDDERGSPTSLSGAKMEQLCEEEMSSPPAETARDLLAAVMALDRESVVAAPVARRASGAAQTTLSESSQTASLTAPAAPEEDRLRDLYVSLEAMGTPSSLSAWSLQQLQREEEEARLHRQAANAWISPAYVPQ